MQVQNLEQTIFDLQESKKVVPDFEIKYPNLTKRINDKIYYYKQQRQDLFAEVTA